LAALDEQVREASGLPTPTAAPAGSGAAEKGGGFS